MPSATSPENNDSFEIFASGFGTTRTGDYTKLDHHFIVDYRGLSLDFSNVTAPTPHPSTVARTAKGYRIELTISADALGGPLGPGQTLYVDGMLNDGVEQRKYLIWALTPHASCACDACSCNFSPAYDTLLFAPFTLVP